MNESTPHQHSEFIEEANRDNLSGKTLDYARGGTESTLTATQDELTLSADRDDVIIEAALWMGITLSALGLIALGLFSIGLLFASTNWRWADPTVTSIALGMAALLLVTLGSYSGVRALHLLRRNASRTHVTLTPFELSIVEGHGRRRTYGREDVVDLRFDAETKPTNVRAVVAKLRVFSFADEHFVRLRVCKEHVEPVRVKLKNWIEAS